MRVWLFTTCLTDMFYPQTAAAMVRVLRRLGVEVDYPPKQTCCGQPAYNNGFFDEARKVARYTVEVLENADAVVIPSSSCCGMIRKHYEDLFEDEPAMARRARALADKTFEFVEFLHKRLWDRLSSWPLRYDGAVTYHYSCHLRLLDMTDQGEQLLRRIEGLEYRPLAKLDQCCGFGGAFAFRFPQVSAALVADKVECIAATGAQTVVATDAGCAMNIAGQCKRCGLDVRVRHIADLLDEAMGNGSTAEGAGA